MKKVVLLVVVLVTAINSGRANYSVDVSPFCLPNDVARKLSKDADKVVCTQWVNGSKSWEEAMGNAIKGLVEVAEDTKHKALGKFNSTLNYYYPDDEASKAPILGNCSQAFDAYLEWAKDPKRDWERDVDHFSTCKEMLKEHCSGCGAKEVFDTFGSFNGITQAVASAKSGAHGCCETAIFDESYNSARFCQYATYRAHCEKWVYASRNWSEAIVKGVTNARAAANATKPMALDSIRDQLVSLGVDPAPVLAACSQAFDAYLDAKTRVLQDFRNTADISADTNDNVAHFNLCKKELLDKADLSLPEINRFDWNKNIYDTINAIIQAKYN